MQASHSTTFLSRWAHAWMPCPCSGTVAVSQDTTSLDPSRDRSVVIVPDCRINTDTTLNNILRLQWRICQTSHGKQPWEKTQVHLSIQPLFGMEPLLSGGQQPLLSSGQPVLPRLFLQDPEFSQVQQRVFRT